MTEEDLDALRVAAATLEHPSLASRLGNTAGKPIELVGRALPEAASEAVAAATTKALYAALAVALRTMEKEPKAASRLLHKALAAASGAARPKPPPTASRFGVMVTQKLAAQAVPVIGALGGAAVNYAFIDHFQEVARAHFVVRRLERRYGKSAVRTAYERFCCETEAAA